MGQPRPVTAASCCLHPGLGRLHPPYNNRFSIQRLFVGNATTFPGFSSKIDILWRPLALLLALVLSTSTHLETWSQTDLSAPSTTPDQLRRPSARARLRLAAPLVAVLFLTTSLSGCLVVDFFSPQKDDTPTGPTSGMVRVWAAAKPGAIGPEYSHYNVTFGWTGISPDKFLNEYVAMRSKNPTVDLVAIERDQQAMLIAELVLPKGDYHGFAITTTAAKLGIDRIVGNDNGKPITRVEEIRLPHSQTGEDVPMSIRAAHVVNPETVTDLYVEIDLVRSLIYEKDALQHRTLPHAVSVYVGGAKVQRILYDGGQEDAEARGQNPNSLARKAPDLRAPWAEIDIRDAETDRIKYNGARFPLKRMNEAIGLHEELIFDATDSISYVMTGEGRMPIEEYLWDFGDGTTAKGPKVAKNYTQGGLFEVVLTVRDGHNLVSQNYATLFVPYTADQAKVIRTDDRASTIFVASGAPSNVLGDETELPNLGLHTQSHAFTFPADLEGGDLYLGGYRVSAEFRSAGGGAVSPLTAVRLSTDSGHFQGSVSGLNPLEIASAGLPVWRGPLQDWVSPELNVAVELQSGAAVDYTLHVEALYYDNLSRGRDPHAQHRHGDWSFGPIWSHLNWDGRVLARDEVEA